jgi:hypothetical protein
MVPRTIFGGAIEEGEMCMLRRGRLVGRGLEGSFSVRERMVVISLVVLAVSVGPLLCCRSAEATITHKYVSQLIGFTQVNALAVGGAGEVYVANRAECGIRSLQLEWHAAPVHLWSGMLGPCRRL